ncbi:MAG: cysteine--tRNA ligase [Candidatus Izemoplasmatales bacterium]
MEIFNSHTNQLETFKSIKRNEIMIYVCGPTVYNYIHIGNARPVVFFDTVRRFFEYKGYKVRYVSNFTDVDDKIIQKAIDDKMSEIEVSEKYINAFLNDLSDLNCKIDYEKPKVTEYMDFIIDFIQDLIDKGYAYKVDGDVYFRVTKIKEYGHLSNRNLDDLISGSRVDINPKKESPLDFTLWKQTDVGINFDSPFSKGRPGWHTECVSMIDDIFHQEIDIHGGGMDLKFPHHENEIAQSRALHNHGLARYWMHNGRVSFNEEKMSKSLGNVILVKDVEEKMALRLFLLSTHYRSPLNYDEDSFNMYVKEWQKLETTFKRLYYTLKLEENYQRNLVIENQDLKDIKHYFIEVMEQDFNTANAITALQSLLKIINLNIRKKDNYHFLNQALKLLKEIMRVLGLKVVKSNVKKSDISNYKAWIDARNNKNFQLADQLRYKLIRRGLL